MLVPLVIGGVIVAWAVTRKGKKTTREEGDTIELVEWTEEEAIDTAIAEGGDLSEMTSTAYFLAYPDCPELLDPDDPSHEACVALWLEMRTMIAERVGASPEGDPLYVDDDEWRPPPVEPEQELDYGECDPLDPDTWVQGLLCEADDEGRGWFVPEGACTVGVAWNAGQICAGNRWVGLNYWLPDNVQVHHKTRYGPGEWYGHVEFDPLREPAIIVWAWLTPDDIPRASAITIGLGVMLAEQHPDLPVRIIVQDWIRGTTPRKRERAQFGIYPGRPAPGWGGTEPEVLTWEVKDFTTRADIEDFVSQKVAQLRYQEGV